MACLQTWAGDVTSYKKNWRQILQMIDEAGLNGAKLIVLPECAYPGYFLGYDMRKTREALENLDAIRQDLSEMAKRHGAYIAAGVAAGDVGTIANEGWLFDPAGDMVFSTVKSNLWHFDRRWFKSGTSLDVVDTDIGRIGLMICADGRAPEIARVLALKGAEIIIDLANLTATGKDPSKLSNPQFDYMLSVRAYENNVWLIMADKVGIEADTVVYAGKSCVISPEGKIIAAASSDKAEILYADIEVKKRRSRTYKRRPEAYSILTESTEDTPIYSHMKQPVVMQGEEIQASVVQFSHENEVEYLNKAMCFIRSLEYQDSALIVLPQLKDGIDLEHVVNNLRMVLWGPSTILAVTGYRKEHDRKYKSTLIFSKEEIFGRYDKWHIQDPEDEGITSGCLGNAIIKTPLGNLGVMHDQEGLIPEMSRVLMLAGADIILWSDSRCDDMNEAVVRTRSAENQAFVMRAGSGGKQDFSMIADPRGQVLASTFKGQDQGVSAMIVTALARAKTVVSGTNVVLGRYPQMYKELVK